MTRRVFMRLVSAFAGCVLAGTPLAGRLLGEEQLAEQEARGTLTLLAGDQKIKVSFAGKKLEDVRNIMISYPIEVPDFVRDYFEAEYGG